MKYLDETIEVKINNINVPIMGNYQYRVMSGSEIIFIGQTYIDEGTTDKDFDISDIVSNYTYINKAILNDDVNKDPVIKSYKVILFIEGNEYESNVEDVYLAYRYPHQLKRLNRDSKALLQGGLIPVYPNVDTDEYGVNYSIYTDADTDKAITIQYKHNDKQGISLAQDNYTNDETIAQTVSLSDVNDYQTSIMFPNKYTLSTTSSSITIASNGKGFLGGQLGQSLRVIYNLVGSIADITLGEYTWENDDEGKVIHFSYKKLTGENIGGLNFAFVSDGSITGTIRFGIDSVFALRGVPFKVEFDFKLNDAINNEINVENIKLLSPLSISPSITEGVHLMLIDSNRDVSDDIKIADFCDVLDGYYLQWQDRMGGLQSQHFTGNPKFLNSYDHLSITDYSGKRRNVAHTVSPKWEINSGWITEDKYPYYESIFVSPYLKLYDVKEDKSYFVVITDNLFEEKTFHNQGKNLFNIKLNLEKDIKQNIIY